jgi:hypothetical protein
MTMEFSRHIYLKTVKYKISWKPELFQAHDHDEFISFFHNFTKAPENTNNSVGPSRRSSTKQKYFSHCRGVQIELKHLHDFLNCRTKYCIAGGIIVLCAATMSSALRPEIWETESTSVCNVEQNVIPSVRLSRKAGIKAQRIVWGLGGDRQIVQMGYTCQLFKQKPKICRLYYYYYYYYYYFLWLCSPAGYGLLVHEVSWSHTTTLYSR